MIRRLKLGPKIGLAVGTVLLLTSAVVAGVAVSYVAELGAYIESSHNDAFIPFQQVEKVDDAFDQMQVVLASGVAAGSRQRLAQRTVIDSSRRVVAAGLANYEHALTLGTQPQMRAILVEYGELANHEKRELLALATLRSEVPRLNALIDTVWALEVRGQIRVARVIFENQLSPSFGRVTAATNELMQLEVEESVFATRAGQADLQRTERAIGLAVALALLVALSVIGWLTGTITRSLRALVAATNAVAEGDFSQSVAITTGDEIGVLSAGFNHMVDALRRERDLAQRYLHTAEVILLGLDARGRITLVNRYACSVFGWREDELLGRDFIETCVPAAIRAETLERLGGVLAGPDSSIVDNAIVTQSGEIRMVEWRNTLIRDSDGVVVGTISSGTDITERNRATETLRVTEERMRFALEAAGIGIWDMDYATGVHNWSETLERHYGLAAGAFAGTFEAFVERIHPDDRAAALAVITQAVKTGSEFALENRTIWPDGSVRWLSGRGAVQLGTHGEPVRAVGISMDVTERHTLEAQYQQSQKMEAIGRLAGGVAHDFNNLLNVILGHCELLVTDLGVASPNMADVVAIQTAGRSAAGLTRRLLAFSRKEIIEPTVLDLNAVVTDLRSMLERLIGEDVTILLGLRLDLGRITADRGQLEQILLNLSVNARDAMLTGGTLTIETRNVELDEHYAKTHLGVTPGHYVALTVTDTGTGITPEVQARLFEPFFTTKEVGKGTGLGLAMVHGIVTQSGGSVNVYSELGRGTSFTMYFPRAEATDTVVAAPPPVARPDRGTETVLVVEDADALRNLTKRLLQRQGYTVLVAANAKEAQAEFDQNESIDLILTDVVMPGASGPELTNRLVEQRPGLKIVYMSGYTEDAIVHHGVLNPGIAFLHKPFTSDSLARKLREVLDR